MPILEGRAKVTDRAGPAGPEPDQLYIVSILSVSLSFFLSVCLSEPAGLGLMKCRLMVGRGCELRNRDSVHTTSFLSSCEQC